MHTSASTPSLPEADLAPAPTNVRAGKASFALMYLLFAILGLAGSMIGALVPALRVIYALDFAQAMAAQWVVLIVSGALSLPVLRLSLLALVSVATAAVVGQVGIVGFVGLVGPHIARMLVGDLSMLPGDAHAAWHS